ncbi:MAG: serine hydrolase [Dehalococcoidia bacterium]
MLKGISGTTAAVAVGIAALLTGCGPSAGPAETPAAAGPNSLTTPSAVVTETAQNRLIDTPDIAMEELSPEAAEYLASRPGPISAAVLVPERGAIYTWNGHEQLHMASVAKVAIMVTVLRQAAEQGRELTSEEIALLTPMIAVSDNPSATALWNQVGGGLVVEDVMRSAGLNEITPDRTSCWGASYASAHDVAMLFGLLAWGDILPPKEREFALNLLQQIDPSQTWGVVAASPAELPNGTVIGVKDGWYPADCGWWVNSAGMILPGNEKPAYTIAVLTGEQPTLEAGIETLETFGELIHEALH